MKLSFCGRPDLFLDSVLGSRCNGVVSFYDRKSFLLLVFT